MSRLGLLRWAAAAAAAFGLTAAATSGAAQPVHGVSAFGELAYGPDFEHFAYVNPDAPRGGVLRLTPTTAARTFEHFNPLIFAGSAAAGSDLLLYDTLLTRAYDEPDAVYGLLAESVEILQDGRELVFRLRPEARFSDGTTVEAADVAWSVEMVRDFGRPNVAQGLTDVIEIEVVDPTTVRFVLGEDAGPRVVFNIGRVLIFSKDWHEGRDWTSPSLDSPVGSGPYAVGDFEPRRFIEYVRRDDYWADDLPVRRGQFNFEAIRFLYFLDSSVSLEAFSADDYDVREEFRSQFWATAYDFPAVEDGRVLRELMPDGRPAGTQGFFFNLRRPQFQDRRVREAISLLFDFERTNAQLFYDLYTRTDSFFENSDLEPVLGAPEGAVLALLEPFRDQLPPSIFAELWLPNVTAGDGAIRRELRRAQALFEEAGWTADSDGRLVNADGDVFEIVFLMRTGSSLDRIIRPFIDNLERIGVVATIRTVDPTQYEALTDAYDFDVVTARLPMLQTPGAELRGYLGSDAAARPGSFNLAGVSSPVVDALLEALIRAETRADLQAAARALDRVIRAEHFWLPQWSRPFYPIAYWDRFGRPRDLGLTEPPYNRGVVRTWWWDADRADAVGPQGG